VDPTLTGILAVTCMLSGGILAWRATLVPAAAARYESASGTLLVAGLVLLGLALRAGTGAFH